MALSIYVEVNYFKEECLERVTLCARVCCVGEQEITVEGQGSIRTLLIMSPFGPHSIELAGQGLYQSGPRLSLVSEKQHVFIIDVSGGEANGQEIVLKLEMGCLVFTCSVRG